MPRLLNTLKVVKKLISISALCLLFFPVITQASTYDSFIEQSKSEEALKISPYQKEVEQIKIESYQKAQAPEIQNSVQEIRQKQVEILQKRLGLAGGQEGQVYVFVSSSMSTTSLQQWFSQAQALHIPLVLRGFVNNNLMNTKIWIKQLVENNKKKGGFEIDPPLFEKYHITGVPAVVVTTSAASCPPNESCLTPPYDVVYGNVSLETSLTAITKYGDSGKTIASNVLQKMKLLQNKKYNQRSGSFYG